MVLAYLKQNIAIFGVRAGKPVYIKRMQVGKKASSGNGKFAKSADCEKKETFYQFY